jgi:serine/threonine protein kinase
MGLVEGICVMNSSGHVRCIEGQFCNENGDSCTNGSFAAASFAQHERLVVDVEVGVLLFLGHTWHLLFYYRYFLLTLLKRMFPSKARDPDEGSHQITEMASMEQHPDCCAQMEFMGFPSDAARQAAAATGGDLDAAVDWLQEHPGAPYEDVLRFLDLNVIEKVGRGGFGSVYKCSRPLQRGISIAVKVISYANNSKDAQHATREGQRLANCDHENIVRMYKPHQPSKFPGICVLEMEFVAGGDLRRHLQHRLPHDVVKRFTIQLLNALVYLHDNKQLLHGDIKPHNILIKCDSLSIDGCVDYSNSVLKLADFGLAKSFASEASNDSTTRAGAGTAPYMSSEALRGQPRCCADDLWSACLVILEMDTGMPLQQLMQGLGSVNINALLIHASSDFLPMLHSVLIGNDASRRRSARDLLRHLEFCVESIFEWQAFDGSEFLAVSAAAAFVLENAFTAGSSTATLQLPPPLDLEFDIRAVCDKADGLGTQTHALSGGHPCAIRRMLKQSVNSIPVWQQLNSGTYWRQCSPQLCAKLEFESQVMQRANVVAHSRRLLIQPDSLGPAMIPFPLQREAYCVTLVSNGVISHPFASPADIDALAAQVHQSLPEFDITNLEAVVNQTLERKYAAYRHRIALRCNGNPNERFLFHFCPESIIPKIWQEGDGHDPRLSQWAEVGKGAYFSEHVIYGYAYRFNLWEGAAEPAIGQSFRVFVTLVALGNCKDLGVGCGTCTSPEWEEWKTEFVPMRIDNPTRPPGFSLPSDAGQCKHLLDLMGVRDRPRYDSVMSTEGDLGTSPASTYMNKARTHLVRDVMHPRLLLRPRDWGRQYVVFETSACYPMYILTLTKQRDAHGALNSRSH